MNFTGHNWPLYKVIYYRFLPSWMDEGYYSLQAFTYGYIQTWDVEFYVQISSIVRTGFPIQLGNNIHGGVPLMSDSLFVSIPENTTVEVWALLGGVLSGVDVFTVTADSSIFGFSIYGFYGRGHFFYVDREGTRWFDYGLDTGSYTVFIPEFRRTGSGRERIFYQEASIIAVLSQLEMDVGVYFPLERMIKIAGVVHGDVTFGFPATLPLVWVEVTTDTRVGYSYDGDYYLHMPPPPAGDSESVYLTFNVPGYDAHIYTFMVTRGTDVVSYIPPALTQSGEPFTYP